MQVEESLVLAARPSRVWEQVADPARYREWMVGVTHFEPVGGQSAPQVGGRYAMRMQVGSAEVGGVVEVVEYDRCKDIAWVSISGMDQRGRIRIREAEPGVTTVTLRVSYQSPGGVWGLLADRVGGRDVRAHLRDSLQQLRRRTEASTAGGGGEEADPLRFLRTQLQAARVIASTGLLRPSRPDRLVAAGLALYRWGLTIPGGFTAGAARFPDATAVIDDTRQLSFAELDARSNAIASGLTAAGIGEGDRVGVLCRNHAGFVEALVALTKVGADVLLLNTGFATPQLRDVLQREQADAIVHDSEFTRAIGDAVRRKHRFVAWTESGRPNAVTLERLASRGGTAEPPRPDRASRITILTSGTTGTPKGAERSQPRSADPILGLLSRIPLRARGTTLIAAPLFHAWGLAHLGFGVVLSSTIVLQRRFEPEAVLAAVERHQATALVAIPVMLRRILDLPEQVRSRYDTSSLQVVAVSGSALNPELAAQFMDTYGDILYNLYGSTEVAAAAIATPEDMRLAPGTVGRPPHGTVLKLLDETGAEVAPGATGRIAVANDLLFEGYTHGEQGTVIDGLVATGDLGRMDPEGRLFVVGRSDDMIVSGGENVFPQEVEELLLTHPDIRDCAVVGVSDEEWGARLCAYIVKRGRARLDADGVKQYVKARLARYKVPRDVEFVAEIPRSPTGKVVRGELATAGGGS